MLCLKPLFLKGNGFANTSWDIEYFSMSFITLSMKYLLLGEPLYLLSLYIPKVEMLSRNYKLRWIKTKNKGFFFFSRELPLTWDFPHSSVGKESVCNSGDLGSVPGSGRSLGEGNGNPLQYSCLENPMDRGAWQAKFHGVTRVGHDLVTKSPPPPPSSLIYN